MGLHTGHRARVRQKIAETGLSGFADHEVLEALLFYAIPYRDTNPIAHELISRSGSLAGVFRMREGGFDSVPGCGEHAATFLKVFAEVGRRAFEGKTEGTTYRSREALARLALERVPDTGRDATYLFLFDNHARLLWCERVFEGYLASSAFRTVAVAEPALRYRASMAMLASCHANRLLYPDPYEYTAYRQIEDALRLIGVTPIEHFLISGDLCAPMEGSGTDRGEVIFRE